LILRNYRATLKEIINILGAIMEKSATLHSRIDKKTKDNAEKILTAIGINHSEAINLFYRQIVLRRGIPFSLEIPNEETLKAIKELESGKKVKSFKTIKKLFADLDN
jgi:DNA-damage-inducible protein J